MRNIYELFESKIEEELDAEYFSIQESLDEFLIMEEAVYKSTLIENLIYDNPDKKRLDVLIEEAEVQAKNNIIDKLIEQMKRVLKWISDIVTKHTDIFDAGVEFIKNNDLNRMMQKLKASGKNYAVTCHPNKTAFPAIRNNRISLIKINIRMAKNANGGSFKNSASEKYNSSEDTEATDHQQALVKFKLDDENVKEVPITSLNVVSIMTNLNALPSANRELKNFQNQVKDVYNKMINKIRNSGTTDKKAVKGENNMAFLNARIREINESIRSYAKIMRMIYNEDFSIAKSIVRLAGGNVEEGDKEVKNNPENNQQAKPQPERKKFSIGKIRLKR